MINESAPELITPFVVCKSNGGEYDDDSFVAGCRFNKWMLLLCHRPGIISDFEIVGLIPQLDLLSMKEGYNMTVELLDDITEWVYVTFTRVAPVGLEEYQCPKSE